MANLIRKRGSSPMAQGRREGESDPFAPWEEWLSPHAFRRELGRLFDDFFSSRVLESTRQFVPSIEMSESEGEYLVSAELPGLSEDDVQIEIDDDNLLTIRGEKKSETAETKGGQRYSERTYGEFVRAVQIPRAVDVSKAEATFEGGVLQLHIPKVEQARARAIPIAKSAAEKQPQAKAVEGNGSRPQEPRQQQKEASRQ